MLQILRDKENKILLGAHFFELGPVCTGDDLASGVCLDGYNNQTLGTRSSFKN